MRLFIRVQLAAFCAAGSLVFGACGGVIDPSKNTVETFTGTLEPGGITFPPHEFNARSGEFSVRINELTPTSNIFMGLLWGQMVNGQCARLQENIFARVGLTGLAGQVLTNSRYCVQVFDVGGVTTATTYSIAVSHP
jgi:hypothetical protein